MKTDRCRQLLFAKIRQSLGTDFRRQLTEFS
jgi:hypothetical protein